MNQGVGRGLLAAVMFGALGCESRRLPLEPAAATVSQSGLSVSGLTVTSGTAARGDTVTISFDVVNAGGDQQVSVQALLVGITYYTDGHWCGEGFVLPGEALCANELDIVELRGPHPLPECQFVDPDAVGQTVTWLRGGSSRHFTWRWVVARLACNPLEPEGGVYTLKVTAHEMKDGAAPEPVSDQVTFTVL